MISIDANVLIYSRREEATHHRAALRLITALAHGREPWAIAWPCVYEFLRVVTHPGIFKPPTPMRLALEDLASLAQSPSLRFVGAGPRHFEVFQDTILESAAFANRTYDASIAAILIENGVTEFLTNDDKFERFQGIRVRNPFRV